LERPDTASTKFEISLLIVNRFENGFHQWIQHIFLVVADALYGPVAGKPFMLEDFVLGMGTSVASALTAETVFEIIKYYV